MTRLHFLNFTQMEKVDSMMKEKSNSLDQTLIVKDSSIMTKDMPKILITFLCVSNIQRGI